MIYSIEIRNRPTDYIFGIIHFRGHVEILDSLLIVKLEAPYYKNGETIDHWENYNFNGTYKLKRLDSL